MDPLSFVISVVLLTASGALAPGPLLFVTVSYGARSGAKTGLVFSIAHTLIEFSLVMALALGLMGVANRPIVKLGVGIAGGVVLLAFGAVQIYDSIRSAKYQKNMGRVATLNLFLIGLVFTGLNPFFIVWWLTVGANLIILSLEFASLAGVVLMYVCHVWMDYLWLISVAHFSKMGKNIAGLRWYRVVMAIFGAILIYFGITFLINSFT